MKKKEIINTIARDKEFSSIAKKISNYSSLHEDLFQEFIMILLEMPAKKLQGIWHRKEMNYFAAGTMIKMFRSNTSRFIKTHRINGYELLTDELPEEENDNEKKIKLDKIEKQLSKEYWYNGQLVEAWLEEGSLRKLSKRTGIPVRSCFQTINSTIKRVKEKMNPYNILLQVADNITGLQYHRQLVPHHRLGKDHEEFKIHRVNHINNLSYDNMKDMRLVQFLRYVDEKGGTENIIERCKRNNIVTVLDIDDYWQLPKTHDQYKEYTDNKMPEQTEQAIRLVDHVTTTTAHFADIIRQYNKNVTIIPNCLDRDEPQWQRREIKSHRTRLGWIGGVFHYPDIRLMANGLKKLFNDPQLENYQICLGGFNRSKTYQLYEWSMTDAYKSLRDDKEYIRYLAIGQNLSMHTMEDKPYKRLWHSDTFGYGDQYNSIDVSLIPLVENKFSSCKSEIKMIEAGTMGKACIVQNVLPYSILAKNEKNCLVVNAGRDHIDWYVNMRKLILNKSLREDLAMQLNEDVGKYYNIKVHNQTRADLYKHLINQKNK